MSGILKFDNLTNNFLRENNMSRISQIFIGCGPDIIDEVGQNIKKIDGTIDTLSYIPNGKCEKSRVEIKIGRFITKFIRKSAFSYFSITNKEVETFVNSFKSYFTDESDNLKVIEGEDIMKWYLESNYALVADRRIGHLWNSCMRQDERNIYMKLYSDNKKDIKMLILLDNKGKLRSRALLWENAKDDAGNSYKIMDRIYSIYEHDTSLFKKWASKNGYVTKWQQNAKSENLFDINNIESDLILTIYLNEHKQEYFPYLDTFKFYNPIDGSFKNKESNENRYKLTSSEGGFHEIEYNQTVNIYNDFNYIEDMF